MNYFLVIGVTVVPALGWFVLWRIQDKQKEPLQAMILCFCLGIAASMPFFAINHWFPSLFQGWNAWGLLFFLAFSEEVVKAIMLVIGIEVSQKWFDQIVDGLIYGSTVALGFSFAENIFYLLTFKTFGSDVMIVYSVRSLTTMVAHTLFTALFGFFYASAYLRKDIFPKRKRTKPWQNFWVEWWDNIPFHMTIFHLLPNRPSKEGHYPGSLIFEGILLASFLHGFFNVLLKNNTAGGNYSFLIVPFIFLLAYVVWRIFAQKLYVRIIKAVKG